ncbi:hypothetical protein QJS66_12375 [Kocuria rhizophila]|nr:hypothetical protein QJS66_12375 [Kocuria rhizophila]
MLPTLEVPEEAFAAIAGPRVPAGLGGVVLRGRVAAMMSTASRRRDRRGHRGPRGRRPHAARTAGASRGRGARPLEEASVTKDRGVRGGGGRVGVQQHCPCWSAPPWWP